VLTERFTAIRQDWATLGPDVTDFQHRLITPKSGRMILSHRSARPDHSPAGLAPPRSTFVRRD
jgi:hypothetical protein